MQTVANPAKWGIGSIWLSMFKGDGGWPRDTWYAVMRSLQGYTRLHDLGEQWDYLSWQSLDPTRRTFPRQHPLTCAIGQAGLPVVRQGTRFTMFVNGKPRSAYAGLLDNLRLSSRALELGEIEALAAGIQRRLPSGVQGPAAEETHRGRANLLRTLSATFANLPEAKTTCFAGFPKTHAGVFRRELFWYVCKKYRDTHFPAVSRSTAITKMAKVELRCREKDPCVAQDDKGRNDLPTAEVFEDSYLSRRVLAPNWMAATFPGWCPAKPRWRGAIERGTRQFSASEKFQAKVPNSLVSTGSPRYTQQCAVWADRSTRAEA